MSLNSHSQDAHKVVGPKSKFSHAEMCGEPNLGEHHELIEEYEIEPPFSSVRIILDKDNGTYSYRVTEPTLEEKSLLFAKKARHNFISSILSYPLNREERIDYIRKFLENFDRTLKSGLPETELEKVFYSLYREFEGYGAVEVPIMDDNIEDISCVGSKVPIYVVHWKLGTIVSNLAFDGDRNLDDFVRWIVQRSGKHISLAVPMVDCSLPNGARLQATFGREVTKNGSSFTIRRFRQDPFTPIDLIQLGTMNSEIAVYLWQAVENGENMFIIGGTASGKTTTLNSILLFVSLNKKLVSIEDTKELNIPHDNWVQSITRQGSGDVNPATRKRVGELDMFDLLVNSLRQRPDYIIVGEVRGREAYTVFQSMATGQTAISTFHSSDIPSFVHRLEGEPLNIPRSMISSLDVVVLQAQVQIGESTVRRITKVVEIVGVEKSSNEVVTNTVFEWDPATDKFIFSGHSYLHHRILKTESKSLEQLNEEIIKRKSLLEDMGRKQRMDFSKFSEKLNRYHEESNHYDVPERDSGSPD